ncbi:hypothetical protein BX666DRAFT_939173 [Dichotomocladium elegans]|nr:hypothetical protein BX666DRAFT_939173 [Dichotomocladium elegans]
MVLCDRSKLFVIKSGYQNYFSNGRAEPQSTRIADSDLLQTDESYNIRGGNFKADQILQILLDPHFDHATLYYSHPGPAGPLLAEQICSSVQLQTTFSLQGASNGDPADQEIPCPSAQQAPQNILSSTTSVSENDASSLPYTTASFPTSDKEPLLLPHELLETQGRPLSFDFNDGYKLLDQNGPPKMPSCLIDHGCLLGFILKTNVKSKYKDEISGLKDTAIIIWDVYQDAFCFASLCNGQGTGYISMKNIQATSREAIGLLDYWRPRVQQIENKHGLAIRSASLVCRVCCGPPFKRYGSLFRHYRKHNPPIHKCDSCVYESYRLDAVKRHSKIHDRKSQH